MKVSKQQLSTLVLLYCVVLSCFKLVNSIRPEDVTGATQNIKGDWIVSHDGVRFLMVLDETHGTVYFYDPIRQLSTWLDPRTGQMASREPLVNSSDTQKNSAEGVFGSKSMPSAASYLGPNTSILVALVPVLLLIAGAAGRIFYLQVYFPDVLFPTKERKNHKSRSAANKPQKSRGKMSQDGKGGRSANS